MILALIDRQIPSSDMWRACRNFISQWIFRYYISAIYKLLYISNRTQSSNSCTNISRVNIDGRIIGSNNMYSLYWSSRRYGSPRNRQLSWRKRGTARHRSTTFYDPEKIWLANRDSDNTVYIAYHPLPTRLFCPFCKEDKHACDNLNIYCRYYYRYILFIFLSL